MEVELALLVLAAAIHRWYAISSIMILLSKVENDMRQGQNNNDNMMELQDSLRKQGER